MVVVHYNYTLTYVQQHNKLVWVVFSSICDMESFHTTYCVGKATELVRLKRLSSIHYYNECRKLRCANVASRHVMLSLKSVRENIVEGISYTLKLAH